MLGDKFYKPRVLFLENVKNLQAHDNGRTYKVIKQKLEDCGYKIFEKVLNTMDYSDLPQNRERIYIIGLSNEKDIELFNIFDEDVLSNLRKNKTSEEKVSEIKKVINYDLTKNDAEKYYYTKTKYPNYFVSLDEFEKSKKETLRDSIKGMVNAITYYQTENEIFTGGTYTVDGSSLKAGSTKIEVDGSILGTGTIIMNSKDEATIKIQYQQYCATGSLKNLKVEKKRCN